MYSRPKFAFLFAAVLLAGCCGLPQIDGVGGVRLVYEIDRDGVEDEIGDASMIAEDLQRAISRRLRSMGPFGIEVVPLDESSVEISIAGATLADLLEIKQLIEVHGDLALMIVANTRDDEKLIDVARQSEVSLVRNDEGEEVGRWTNISDTPAVGVPVRPEDTLRAKNKDGEYFALTLPDEHFRRFHDDSLTLMESLEEMELSQPQVLLRLDSNPNGRVTGAYLRSASVGTDNAGRPAVRFYMTEEGAKRLTAVSTKNLPDARTDFHRRMAIVFDGEVVSAPQINDMISDSGIITGDFTQDEVKSIVVVLNAGRLPVSLKPEPIQETWVEPQ